MEAEIRKLFERYERGFNQALDGQADMDAVVSLYASEFISAAPVGVRAGKNDDTFRQALAKGYDHYREIGMKAMRIRDVRISAIDDLHCVVRVAWTATYVRPEQPEVAIDFDVHYFVQTLDGTAKVFGWVSGDEGALLKRHGIV